MVSKTPHFDIRVRGFLLIILTLAFLCLGMSRAPGKKLSPEARLIGLRSVLEITLGDIEYAYESKDLQGFLDFLDKGFAGRGRFQSGLEAYFFFINKPHIHFVIDIVVADKHGITVRLHWFRKAVTGSDVLIRSQGSTQFLFKKYPEGLKLKGIYKDNPFF